MALQVATTAGTIAGPVPSPTNEGGSIHETHAATDAKILSAVNGIAGGTQLTQEVNDFVRVVAQNASISGRAALVAIYRVCKRLLDTANDLTAERTYTP